MNNYKQITRDERAIISDLWIKGKSYYYIANWMSRKYDTIRDEIERNGEVNQFDKIIYSSKKAHKKYLERRKISKQKVRIIENNPDTEEIIQYLITEEQMSPDQIAGRYKTVSHRTIYNWIYRMTYYTLKKILFQI